MPRATTRARALAEHGRGPGPKTLSLSSLFPEHPRLLRRGPMPKQRLIFVWTQAGALQGGGFIYQGGKGSGKTLVGAAWIIWLHLLCPGLNSLIGRETYPGLCTSTAEEFFKILRTLPPGIVASATMPSKNSMGYVQWTNKGVTLLCSMSDSSTWESANLGAAWVDEGHRTDGKMAEALSTRLRQPEGPRAMGVTSNSAGRWWGWMWANEKSKERLPHWNWVEATIYDNPTLPDDYIARMEAKYPKGTSSHKRWLLGSSSALEGATFPFFDPDPTAMVHVVPSFELPMDWEAGRGMDWGLTNPTAVVWGAKDDPEGFFWIYQTHSQAEWPVPKHAEKILEMDGERYMGWCPADPSMFAPIHTDKMTGLRYSSADEFAEHGVILTRANNDRKYGLQLVYDMLSLDPQLLHPSTLTAPAPRILILDNDSNLPLIECIQNLQWLEDKGTRVSDIPDDVKKRNDHEYDALRYLVAEAPIRTGGQAPILPSRQMARGNGSYRGY